MVNRKGLKALGYDSPEEIIGKTLRIEHEAVGYIPQGVVCGVTDDFNYTSMREESIPMIIMQRPLERDFPRLPGPLCVHRRRVRPDIPQRAERRETGPHFLFAVPADRQPRPDYLHGLHHQAPDQGDRHPQSERRPIGRNHPGAEPQLYIADRIGVRGRHSGRLYHPATMAPEFRLQNEPRLVDFRRCRDNRPAPVRDRRLVAKLARGNRQSGECNPERINPGRSVNGPQHPGGNTDSPYDIRDILKVVLRTSPL